MGGKIWLNKNQSACLNFNPEHTAWFWAIYLIAHDKRGSSSHLLKDCTWYKLPNGLGNFPQNS